MAGWLREENKLSILGPIQTYLISSCHSPAQKHCWHSVSFYIKSELSFAWLSKVFLPKFTPPSLSTSHHSQARLASVPWTHLTCGCLWAFLPACASSSLQLSLNLSSTMVVFLQQLHTSLLSPSSKLLWALISQLELNILHLYSYSYELVTCI